MNGREGISQSATGVVASSTSSSTPSVPSTTSASAHLPSHLPSRRQERASGPVGGTVANLADPFSPHLLWGWRLPPNGYNNMSNLNDRLRIGERLESRISDHSFTSLLGSGPPPKRKRTVFDDMNTTQQVSTIKDTRINPALATRLTSPPITVHVGTNGEAEDGNDQPSRETFYVHESAICDASPYFANAMKPEWSSLRADPRVIELPDDDPAAFELYLSWIYSKQLPILSTPTEPAAPGSSSSWEPESNGYHTLAYAYVLGDRLLDTSFKNAIVDAYVLYARGIPPAKRYYPSTEEIRILYEGTREDAPIRQLLVDIWTARGKSEWIDADPNLPPEFLAQVLKGMFKHREKNAGSGGAEGLSRPWKLSHDQYHEKV